MTVAKLYFIGPRCRTLDWARDQAYNMGTAAMMKILIMPYLMIMLSS